MNEAILYAINSWVGTSPTFDEVLLHLASNPLFKGMPPLFIFWWLWGMGTPAAQSGGLICLLVCLLLRLRCCCAARWSN